MPLLPNFFLLVCVYLYLYLSISFSLPRSAGMFDGSAERVWVLDPVDGTKGFMRGEHYCIALALLVKGEQFSKAPPSTLISAYLLYADVESQSITLYALANFDIL